MQVFKTYFKILKKNLTSVIIFGVIFITITLVITLTMFHEDNGQFSVKKVPTLVINQDTDSNLVDGFLTYLEQYATFVDIEEDEEIRRDALFYRKVLYILTIPEGFTEDFLAGNEINLIKETVPDSVEAMSVDTAVNNYLNTAKIYIKHNPDVDLNKLGDFIQQDLGTETKVTFDVKQEDDTTAAHMFNSFYYNYLGYIIVACFIAGVSTVMLSFHGLDIRRKHYAAPLSSRRFNIQLINANLAFVMCYLLVFIIAGYVFSPVKLIDLNLVFMWLNAFVFSLAALSISYLIGISVKAKNAVQALSTMLSLSLAFISGMFVPQEFLGDAVLKLASFTPSYWYVRANNTIAHINNFNLDNMGEIFGYMAIQIGFAAAIISIALVVSKRKRQMAY
ncbi:ABC transporter permease [Mobilitalea sibirica]|uniref:ABC transporter permease n=1 Tax=Mobilitalea sibirica TaxID=1462919 RepID=A0A8J7H1L7_9FIRM|nr:ABC transporter permease [Mobilitalea sibirica]MBH1940110.1 ABC transporter permease [Mobilitalea sibirica]